MIKINNLTKKYGDKIALNNVSFKIKNGDFFSLFGKNGAGKSTTIGIISSLIKKDTGKIYIDTYDLDKDFLYIRMLIGLVPQEYNFNQFESVIEIIINQAGYYGIQKNKALIKAKEILSLFDLWNKKDTPSIKLSGGMKRRLMIARALIHEPKILILDEPTAGVDIISRRLIWNFLTEMNKNGVTIILTTHYLEEIEKLCKNVAIIDNGNIILETTVKNLLDQVEKQIYLIETNDINKFLQLNNKAIQIIKKTENIVEVSLSKNISLNFLLELIVKKKIIIKNIKNEKNNLEDIFIKFIS